MDTIEPPIPPAEGQNVPVPLRKRRPTSVTILLLGVLIITTVNLARLVLSVRQWTFLESWPGVSPLYILLSGLTWTLAGLPLIWGLWRAKAWAPRLMQAFGLTYALYFWVDRVFLEDHPVSGAEGAKGILLPVNWKFAVAATVILLGFMTWTLGRRKVKAYFDRDEGVNESIGDVGQEGEDDQV